MLHGVETKINGFTHFMNREGGIDLSSEIAGQVGNTISGEEGERFARRMDGYADTALTIAVIFSPTNTGKAALSLNPKTFASNLGKGIKADAAAVSGFAKKFPKALRSRFGGVGKSGLGRYVGDLDDAAVASRFDDLLEYRQQLPNFPSQLTGNRSVDGVTARLEVNGIYRGHNGWVRRSGLRRDEIMTRHTEAGFRPNGTTPFHAEGHVFDQALQAGEGGGVARLFVDSTFCKAGCQWPFNGVENMARALGFERVEVFIRLPNGHIVSGMLY